MASGISSTGFQALPPDASFYRDINVYREDNFAKAQDIYSQQRLTFTNSDWRLYRKQGEGDEKFFISYKRVRFDTNHGIPMGVDTKPEIFIGILKQNVFVVIAYTAYSGGSDYIQTINKDILA